MYAVLEIAGTAHPVNFALWFDRRDRRARHDRLSALFGARRDRRSRAPAADLTPGIFSINFVRIPALLSAFVFIVWFPVILGFSEPEVIESTGLGTDPFLGRWLLLTGVMFLISGLLYAVKLRRVRT